MMTRWPTTTTVYEPIKVCPVTIRYIVWRIKRENLIASCLTRNMGCDLQDLERGLRML